jgi:hypothetical protein
VRENGVSVLSVHEGEKARWKIEGEASRGKNGKGRKGREEKDEQDLTT